MMNPQVRALITKEEQELEDSLTSSVILPIQAREAVVELITKEPYLNPAYLSQSATGTANFTSGVAAWCLDNIVKDHDVNPARGRI